MGQPTVEQLDEQIARLQKERREAVKRERKADDEARARVAMAIGDAVLARFGGDWKEVDLDAVADMVAGWSPQAAARPMRAAEAKRAVARFKERARERPDAPALAAASHEPGRGPAA